MKQHTLYVFILIFLLHVNFRTDTVQFWSMYFLYVLRAKSEDQRRNQNINILWNLAFCVKSIYVKQILSVLIS